VDKGFLISSHSDEDFYSAQFFDLNPWMLAKKDELLGLLSRPDLKEMTDDNRQPPWEF